MGLLRRLLEDQDAPVLREARAWLVELGPQVANLREHLDRLEDACRPEELPATVACLGRKR